MMVRHSEAVRSTHPTNSFVAIGRYAKLILSGHDEKSSAYAPVGKIIQMNGKMALVGTVNNTENPAFLTGHYYERELGLYRRSMLRFLGSVYYMKGGKKLKYRRSDPGLCPRPASKLYAKYLMNEILLQGYIGNAYSILTNAVDAAKIDREYRQKYPRKLTICRDLSCINCAFRWDNFWRIPVALTHYLRSKLNKI